MFKVILCGDTEVGKTSILHRLSHNTNASHTTATMGASFAHVPVAMGDENVELNIWDTAGQERYRSLIRIYFRDAHLAVFVVDLTSRESLDGLREWIDLAKVNAGKLAPAGILVGNKTDADNIQITDEQLEEAANREGIKWITVSAKTGFNFERLSTTLGELCLAHQKDPINMQIGQKFNHAGLPEQRVVEQAKEDVAPPLVSLASQEPENSQKCC